jgi:hypothetical protein
LTSIDYSYRTYGNLQSQCLSIDSLANLLYISPATNFWFINIDGHTISHQNITQKTAVGSAIVVAGYYFIRFNGSVYSTVSTTGIALSYSQAKKGWYDSSGNLILAKFYTDGSTYISLIWNAVNNMNFIDVDGTLSTNLDTNIPSEKAVKTYVDAVKTYVDQEAKFRNSQLNLVGNGYTYDYITAENYILNGNFTAGTTSWILGTGWTWDSTNHAAKKATGDTNTLSQTSVTYMPGYTYLVVYTVGGLSTGTVFVSLNGTSGLVRNANGTYQDELIAGASGGLIFTPSANATAAFYVKGVCSYLKKLQWINPIIASPVDSVFSKAITINDPSVPIVNYSNVDYSVLLLHFENNLTDSALGKTVTNHSSTSSTTQAKFGTYSQKFVSASSQYLTLAYDKDLDISSGDFTIDYWAYRTSYISDTNVFAILSTGYGIQMDVQTGAGTVSYLYLSSNGTSNNIANGVSFGTTSLNAWHHYALVRKDNIFYLFLDGVLNNTLISSASIFISEASSFFYIGFSSSSYFDGYVDEFHITKTALWIANFIPPTSAYVYGTPTPIITYAGLTDEYTKLLLHFDNNFTDSALGKTVTNAGSVTFDASIFKFGSYSASFDGSSKYCTVPIDPDLDISTGDFTIDFWEYRTINTIGRSVFSCNVDYNILLGYTTDTTHWSIYLSSNGLTWDISSANLTTTLLLNEWVHYALVRSGNIFMLFQNGIMTSSVYSSLPLSLYNATTFQICKDRLSAVYFTGYLDELRITKKALWTANFTVPQTAYTIRLATTLPITTNAGGTVTETNFGLPLKANQDLYYRPLNTISASDSERYLIVDYNDTNINVLPTWLLLYKKNTEAYNTNVEFCGWQDPVLLNYKVRSPLTSLNIINLPPCNIDEEFDIEIGIYNSTGSTSTFSLYINNDFIATNYYVQTMGTTNTATNFSRSNAPYMNTLLTLQSFTTSGNFKLINGLFRYIVNGEIDTTATTAIYTFQNTMEYLYPIPNITSITIVGSVTNSIGVGSFIRIKKK